MRNNKIMDMQIQSNREPSILKTPKKIIIPLHIYQTWHTLDLPQHMKVNADLLKEQNPEFQYHLYDDNMCREFIQTNFNEDVLRAFERLKPGAYKADLWRYCILYKHGGVYLDIKFVCAKGFKFIYLTDREYWVRDIFHNNRPHVYQALMINMPNNPVLKAAIESIVRACHNSYYDSANSLSLTGPGLLGKFFNRKYILTHCDLANEGTTISWKGIPILTHYAQYRMEQQKKQATSHYNELWENMDIYHYPLLSPTSEKSFTNTFQCHVPCVFSVHGQLYLHLESKDKVYLKDGRMRSPSSLSYTSMLLTMDQIPSKEHQNSWKWRDVKLYFWHDTLYGMANSPMKQSVCFFQTTLEEWKSLSLLEQNVVKEEDISCYGYVEVGDQLHCVSQWYPLKRSLFDKELKTHCSILNMPEFFQDVCKATCGIHFQNQIWFLLGKKRSRHSLLHNATHFKYRHFFVVFDDSMNTLIQYSELFTFSNELTEFCSGFTIEDNEMTLGYSVSNESCFVCRYNMDYILREIKWYVV